MAGVAGHSSLPLLHPQQGDCRLASAGPGEQIPASLATHTQH